MKQPKNLICPCCYMSLSLCGWKLSDLVCPKCKCLLLAFHYWENGNPTEFHFIVAKPELFKLQDFASQ